MANGHYGRLETSRRKAEDLLPVLGSRGRVSEVPSVDPHSYPGAQMLAPQKHGYKTLSPKCKLLKGKGELVAIIEGQLTAESMPPTYVSRSNS